ncbi:MAG: helix-turn-helix domain-containing protein [Actinomycetota bacterium]|nr:helix-turn-helix domain-containing protein [Actinomycetota bacterium]
MAGTGSGLQRTTLSQVLRDLGPSIVQVIVAPSGLDVPAAGPLIYDSAESPQIDRNAIVLAVGVRPDEPDARRLVEVASGAAAVVFKLNGRDCLVAESAEEVGVALLSIPDEVGWSHLHAMLSRATVVTAADTDVAGISGVPLGDLFALANAIAAMAGGAVTIEDARARVLAYSNIEGQAIDEPRQATILGRQVPDTPAIRAIYKDLWASDGPIKIEEIEGLDIRPRIAMPVRVGAEAIGSIWVLEGEEALAPNVDQALREASRVAALHMIQARSSRDVERRVRGDLLRSLLEGRTVTGAGAVRLGIQPDSLLSILAFQLPQLDRAHEELHRERLVDLVALYCEAFHHRAPCVAAGRTVYALLPSKKNLTREWVRKLAGDIRNHAESTLQTPVKAAIGPTADRLETIPRARQEVDRVLRVLNESRDSRKVAAAEDVASQLVLLELKELALEHPGLTQGVVVQIAAHDGEKNTSYLETLRAYLDAYGDVPRAATALNVHPNTFRYRLRRLREIFDLDLDDPNERLVIELQLRLLSGDSTDSN